MDRARLIESAPRCYALAIISHLQGLQGPTTKSAIIAHFEVRDTEDPDHRFYPIHDGGLLDLAIKSLTDDGLIELEHDDFAGLAVDVVKARIKEWLMKRGIPWPLDWS